ncbi:TetR/AcrR family transcriptional regulator [Virgisporangium aurantiacum]|uniref:TetR family transcriptional regulator n=1 Tax=Virgisporangium aurantiacum TaxID=175570 RepID=A0A8J3ZE51_9ACTN|nr:TetR/AcrR family transcriptional regulator [Virgisporangium aurantiacum]GIJ59603.1 TetR family transcriptional regulator [Virgisporangium aurantiacum]
MEAVGLRERKKAATRQALHEAALRLAIEHGIDNVTVEAIADAATVSRRTFSNYFSSKEEALFHADREFTQRLVALVRARPAGEPPWTALSRAAEELLPRELDVDRLASRRLLRNHPSLISHQVAVYATIERDLATELARRMPSGGDTPLRSRILAATFLTTIRVTTQHWLDHPDRPLPELIREALTYPP